MSKLAFIESGEMEDGRLVIWKHPIDNMTYSFGIDCALGIASESTDFDYVVGLDSFGEQVCEFEGRLGGARLKPVLKSLVDYYEQPAEARVFNVFEATAHSTDLMRAMFDDGYWLYYDRDETKKSRRMSDKLGHSPRHDDITISKTRAALAPHDAEGKLLPSKLVIHSSRLLEQLEQYSFLLSSSRKDPAEARDDDYVLGAASGFHDDGTRALCLAYCGLLWLPQYVPPPKPVNPHSFASVLRHEQVGRSHEDVCKSRLAANAKQDWKRR